jgi:hypothetical protein
MLVERLRQFVEEVGGKPSVGVAMNENSEKNCTTCGNRCMDMDMDPYCAAPEVLKSHPFGLVLHSGPVEACKVGDEYTLWEKDSR